MTFFCKKSQQNQIRCKTINSAYTFLFWKTKNIHDLYYHHVLFSFSLSYSAHPPSLVCYWYIIYSPYSAISFLKDAIRRKTLFVLLGKRPTLECTRLNFLPSAQYPVSSELRLLNSRLASPPSSHTRAGTLGTSSRALGVVSPCDVQLVWRATHICLQISQYFSFHLVMFKALFRSHDL